MKSWLRNEWEIFREHSVAYVILFLIKIGLFVAILKTHKAVGIKGEIIPALLLAVVGIGMTFVFHRTGKRRQPPTSQVNTAVKSSQT